MPPRTRRRKVRTGWMRPVDVDLVNLNTVRTQGVELNVAANPLLPLHVKGQVTCLDGRISRNKNENTRPSCCHSRHRLSGIQQFCLFRRLQR